MSASGIRSKLDLEIGIRFFVRCECVLWDENEQEVGALFVFNKEVLAIIVNAQQSGKSVKKRIWSPPICSQKKMCAKKRNLRPNFCYLVKFAQKHA